MTENRENTKDVTVLKVINGTVYRVKVHFSEDAKETMQDKMTKLMVQELERNIK